MLKPLLTNTGGVGEFMIGVVSTIRVFCYGDMRAHPLATIRHNFVCCLPPDVTNKYYFFPKIILFINMVSMIIFFMVSMISRYAETQY